MALMPNKEDLKARAMESQRKHQIIQDEIKEMKELNSKKSIKKRLEDVELEIYYLKNKTKSIQLRDALI